MSRDLLPGDHVPWFRRRLVRWLGATGLLLVCTYAAMYWYGVRNPTSALAAKVLPTGVRVHRLAEEAEWRELLSLDRRAVPALLHLLEHPGDVVNEEDIADDERGEERARHVAETKIRYYVLGALYAIPDPAAVPALRSFIHDDEVLVRVGAIEALGALGPEAAKALPELEAIRDDRSERIPVRDWAARAVADIRGEPAPPRIRQ